MQQSAQFSYQSVVSSKFFVVFFQKWVLSCSHYYPSMVCLFIIKLEDHNTVSCIQALLRAHFLHWDIMWSGLNFSKIAQAFSHLDLFDPEWNYICFCVRKTENNHYYCSLSKTCLRIDRPFHHFSKPDCISYQRMFPFSYFPFTGSLSCSFFSQVCQFFLF